MTKSGTLYYPIFLAYATGVLEQDGFDVKLVDCPAELLGREDAFKIIAEYNPGLIVMDTATPSVVNDMEIADLIKDRFPNVKICFVGTHATALPEETMQRCPAVDYIARGEYDYTVRDLARVLRDGGELKDVEGLAWRGDDTLIFNKARPYIENLDDLPFVSDVYRRHLNIRNYFYAITTWPEVTILTSRGCPFKCTYCVLPQTVTGHAVRYRSPESVAAEFDFIQKELPFVKEVFLEDDTFTLNRPRVREICRLLEHQGNRVYFTCNARADVDTETLRMLHRAKCRLMCVGFESGSQQVLDSVKKGTRLEKVRQFVEDARRSGVMVHGCFMVGMPGDTKETLRETLEFAKEINPDTAQFFPLMVYPGTEAYNWAVSKGYIKADDYDEWLNEEGGHNCVLQLPDFDSEYLVEFCNQARREFYLRPKYIGRKLVQMAKSPKEAVRTAKSFSTFKNHLLSRPAKPVAEFPTMPQSLDDSESKAA